MLIMCKESLIDPVDISSRTPTIATITLGDEVIEEGSTIIILYLIIALLGAGILLYCFVILLRRNAFKNCCKKRTTIWQK